MEAIWQWIGIALAIATPLIGIGYFLRTIVSKLDTLVDNTTNIQKDIGVLRDLSIDKMGNLMTEVLEISKRVLFHQTSEGSNPITQEEIIRRDGLLESGSINGLNQVETKELREILTKEATDKATGDFLKFLGLLLLIGLLLAGLSNGKD